MADSYLTPDVLDAFTSAAMQRDPMFQMGQFVQQTPLNMSTWSPVSQGVGSFAKSFLGTLLGNYAQQNAAQQQRAVVESIPSLMRDPFNAPVPEGVDAGLFDSIRTRAALTNEARNASVNQALAQRGIFPDNPDLSERIAKVVGKQRAMEARGEQLGKLEAFGYKDGEQGTKLEEIPGTPQFEATQLRQKRELDLDARVQDARDFLEKSKLGVTYSEIKPLIKQVTTNLNKTDKAADLTILTALAKAWDPVGAISDQTIRTTQDAIPYLEKAFGTASGFFDGKGYLTEESKLRILEQVANKVNAVGGEYSSLINNEKERLRILGADPSRLSVIDTTPFDMNSIKNTQTISELQQINSQLQQPGITPEQRAALVARARVLYSTAKGVSGRGASGEF